MAEVAAQLPRRRTRVDVGLGDRDIAPLGIIRRLRRPREGACRHCAVGGAANGTQMSHYLLGCRRPLRTAALTLAVLSLSGCVIPRAAAAPLVTGCCLAQLLRAVQVLTAAQAVRLSSVARAADPNGDPAAPAVKLPKLRFHLHPPQHWTAPGEAGIKGLRPAPTGAPQRRGPGVRVVSEPGPSLYLAASITKELAASAIGQSGKRHLSGKHRRVGVKPARRQRGRRMRPSTAGAAGPLAGRSGPHRSGGAPAPRRHNASATTIRPRMLLPSL